MFTIGETVGLAEWIIDDTCLVLFTLFNFGFSNMNPGLVSSTYDHAKIMLQANAK